MMGRRTHAGARYALAAFLLKRDCLLTQTGTHRISLLFAALNDLFGNSQCRQSQASRNPKQMMTETRKHHQTSAPSNCSQVVRTFLPHIHWLQRS